MKTSLCFRMLWVMQKKAFNAHRGSLALLIQKYWRNCVCGDHYLLSSASSLFFRSKVTQFFSCIQYQCCHQDNRSFYYIAKCRSIFSSICSNCRFCKLASIPPVYFAVSTIASNPSQSVWDCVLQFYKWWHFLTLNACKMVAVSITTKYCIYKNTVYKLLQRNHL